MYTKFQCSQKFQEIRYIRNKVPSIEFSASIHLFQLKYISEYCFYKKGFPHNIFLLSHMLGKVFLLTLQNVTGQGIFGESFIFHSANIENLHVLNIALFS